MVIRGWPIDERPRKRENAAKVKRATPVEVDQIGRSILFLRGRRVILDRELAAIYGSTAKRLNEQVKRNRDRFPEDFMFQLTAEEVARSRSQIATLKIGRGMNIKYRPYAFTEHGAIQAANVLNSARATAMGVYIVRAFVQLRGPLAANSDLARKLDELEAKFKHHDAAITTILLAIRRLMNPPVPKRRGIGFTAEIEKTLEVYPMKQPAGHRLQPAARGAARRISALSEEMRLVRRASRRHSA